jgi:excisionase family DNA binding protein
MGLNHTFFGGFLRKKNVMNNPFEQLNSRLQTIEAILLEIKSKPQQEENYLHPERLLSIEEAGEFLNLSKATIYSKVSRNELPYMKKGKRLYFSSAELLDYLKSGKRKTHAELEQEAHELLNNKKGLSNG